ncbi:MAG: GlsB/YeaQ/YmgE family stress response membrane protein [Chloroflexi bacterium]|nr:GlsB/YeaQ/YmgE family stress response membrane protein [Chloroflexota bacterium]
MGLIWGLVSWIVLGALAGWLASVIMGTNQRQGCLANVVIGVVGAFIGGFLVNLLTRADVAFGWNLWGFLAAVLGAVVLLAIVRALRRG